MKNANQNQPNWSDEQVAIFSYFAVGAGNLIVKARAGTGKTTTIKAAFEHAPENRILYAVFNKRNQKEAEEKITDSRVEVRTLHSLGFMFIKKVWSNAKPDDQVEWDRIEAATEGYRFYNDVERREVSGAVYKLVSFAKNTTINPVAEDLRRIADEQDIFVDGFDLAAFAMTVLESSKAKDSHGRISFNDMVWLPCVMGWTRPWFDLVCIDEAQDMNLPQLTMARAAAKPGGRVVVVGDDRQAIYGFRGAVQNGMAMMKATLRAAELGLTTTYRCPKAVVALAQLTVPDYHAADSAPDGLVRNAGDADVMKFARPGDSILSRLNAPLMPIALALIRAGTPARIEGRDIAKQLITMVRTLKASTVENFLTKLELWRNKQTTRLESSKNAEKKIEQVNDIADTLRAVSEGADSVGEIERKINDLFQDSDKAGKLCVILSTVHKAKGLEWDRVFILSQTFIRKPGQKPSNEEANIYYVAVTRSKKELWLVDGGTEPEKAVEVASGGKKRAGWRPERGAEPIEEAPATVFAGNFASREEAATMFESPLPGMVWLEAGSVIVISGVEYVSTRLTPAGAKLKPMTRKTKVIKYREKGTMDEKEKTITESAREITVSRQVDKGTIIRVLSKVELENFLSGNHRAATEQKTNGGENKNDSMSTKKTGSGKKGEVKPGQFAGQSEAGSAKYVRELFAEGIGKEEAQKKAIKKFPFLQIQKHFDYRWNSASGHAKSPKASAKTPVKGKAPAKVVKKAAPAKPVVPKAPRKPSAPAKPVAASAPPRPAAPAAPVETTA